MNKQKEDMTTEELVKDLLEKEEELFSKQRIQEIQILISSLEIVLKMQKWQDQDEQTQILKDQIEGYKEMLELDERKRKYIEFVKRNFPEYVS